MTSLGRQFRRYVRPYFLPLSETAQPGLAKRMYDLIGWISVQSILNYLVAPFLLLDFKDSIGAWNRMYWYGHVAVIISMCFMSFGGRRALKRGLDKRKSRIPPSVKVSPPSPPIDHTPPPPPEDEMDSTDLRWVKHDLDNPEDQDSGEDVAMGVAIRDHGFLDKWIEGEETPGSTPGGTPKYEKDDPLQE